MKSDKNKAVVLRQKGLSYSQISEKLKINKSTLSYWLRDVKVSSDLLKKINERANTISRNALIRRNKQQTEIASKRAEEIKRRAQKEAKKYLHDQLFIVGVALYWAEGYKRGDKGSKWKSFDLANSDPEIIKLMIRFIKRYLPEAYEKISIQVIGYAGINASAAISYWSSITEIKKDRFYRITVYNNPSSKGIRNKKQLPYGTIHLRINDVKVFFRVIGWINGIKTIK